MKHAIRTLCLNIYNTIFVDNICNIFRFVFKLLKVDCIMVIWGVEKYKKVNFFDFCLFFVIKIVIKRW